MKPTTKGIGWLIAGIAIICLLIPNNSGITDLVSSIALGLVFIGLYIIKQYIDPVGIGWYLSGGIMLAFCSDEMSQILIQLIRTHHISADDLMSIAITSVIAAILLCVFAAENYRQ